MDNEKYDELPLEKLIDEYGKAEFFAGMHSGEYDNAATADKAMLLGAMIRLRIKELQRGKS